MNYRSFLNLLRDLEIKLEKVMKNILIVNLVIVGFLVAGQTSHCSTAGVIKNKIASLKNGYENLKLFAEKLFLYKVRLAKARATNSEIELRKIVDTVDADVDGYTLDIYIMGPGFRRQCKASIISVNQALDRHDLIAAKTEIERAASIAKNLGINL